MNSNELWVLGIAASHNGALCLLRGDEIVVAVQEERLLRTKRARIYGAAGSLSLQYCLDTAGITVRDLKKVVLCSQLANRSSEQDPALDPLLQLGLHGIPLSRIGHHRGHAIGAFATSGYKDAAVLVVDGMGSPGKDLSDDEQAAVRGGDLAGGETVSSYSIAGTELRPLEKILVHKGRWLNANEKRGYGMPLFGSLGGFYSAAGVQIFGDPMDGAGKVMGLAPYGKPDIPVEEFFDIVDGNFVFHDKVPNRFQHDDRWPKRQEEYANLAASTQRALEEALLYLARRLKEKTGGENLCYAGGVALNSVANERIIREAGFKNVFIMPAAEDSGTAIGAAYHGLWEITGKNTRRHLPHDAVGRHYSDEEVVSALGRVPMIEARRSTDIVRETATLLAEGKIIGWFQGRSELGPRALGQRSILCDPRGAHIKDTLNSKVKHREGFRPFAPVLPLEHVGEWFETEGTNPASPFMLRVMRFREDKRALVPGVVHVDGTGRVQTLTAEANGLLYELARAFHAQTGVPILLNTSFNVAGEPIAETPEDALWSLLYTGLDACVIHDHVVQKRGGFHSILDLYPRLTVESVALSSKPAQGRLGFDFPREPSALLDLPIGASRHGERMVEAELERITAAYAKHRVSTPWGPATHFSDLQMARLLTRIDGRKTGRELLTETANAGEDLGEKFLTTAIGRMRRASVLSLHAEPDARAHKAAST